MRTARLSSLVFCCAVCALSQSAQLQPAAEIRLPILADSSSPAHWLGGRLYLFQSGELATPDSLRPPLRFQGSDLFHLGGQTQSAVNSAPMSVWIESTWADPNGRLYAWYHREPSAGCADPNLRLPEIGALRSDDNGVTFTDLGVILRAAPEVNCSAGNGFFAGGNGDFSVLPDRAGGFFYFLFTNYAGPAAQQGIAIARMAATDRDAPAGKVWKFRSSMWLEPGLGGQVSPVFPAAADWSRSDADSYWGPSLHYNSYLDAYVALMNRSCCTPGFPEEGVYATFNRDLGDPAGWSPPTRIWTGSKQGYNPAEWYAQVLGLQPGESDKLAGQTARFFLAGTSKYEITFARQATALAIGTASSLPAAVGGVAYTVQLSASGGVPPYRWSISAGVLPPGLVLDPSSGTIGGSPNAAGTYALTAQVSDNAGTTASKAFTIVVSPAPVPLTIVTAASLPGAVAGMAYAVQLSANGGVAPYRWSIPTGMLPPGLVLDPASGTIGGSPNAVGTYAFTAQVSDSAGAIASKAFPIAVSPAPTAIAITTPATLPDGANGTPYLLTLAATGGTAPYRWSLLSGALPPGLQLAASGAMSGVPSAPGSYAFTLQASDSAAGSASRAFSLAIASVPLLSQSPVLNAASYQSSVAPGAIISIFGTDLATASQAADSEPLPLNLNGVSVSVNGIPAPLFYVSSTQINAQMPFEVAAGQASLIVRRGNQASPVRTVGISALAPAIFTVNQSGAGPGLVVHSSDFSLVNTKAPAHVGEYVVLYCTGLGPLTIPVRTGDVPGSPPPQIGGQTKVTVGGVPALVSFAGAAPGFVGLYQVNVRITEGTPSGSDVPVQIEVNGVASNVVSLAIQ